MRKTFAINAHFEKSATLENFNWLVSLIRTLRPDLGELFKCGDGLSLDLAKWLLVSEAEEYRILSESGSFRNIFSTPLKVLDISPVEALVYNERPDVRNAFRLPEDKAGFKQWFYNHGVDEHGLLDFLDEAGKQRYYAAHPEKTPVVDSDPKKFSHRPFGVNLISYADGNMGADLGMTARALQYANIPVGIFHFAPGKEFSQDGMGGAESDGNIAPYKLNIFCMNALDISRFYAEKGFEFFQGRCSIAYWPREFDRKFDEWRAMADLIDEVWVSSRDAYDALAPVSPVPVIIMPSAADLANAYPCHDDAQVFLIDCKTPASDKGQHAYGGGQFGSGDELNSHILNERKCPGHKRGKTETSGFLFDMNNCSQRFGQRLNYLREYLAGQKANLLAREQCFSASDYFDSSKVNDPPEKDDAQTKPAIIVLANGKEAQIKIDCLILTDNHLIVGGWHSEELNISLEVDGKRIECQIADNFPRKDVNVHLGTAPDILHGFSLCAEYSTPRTISLLAGDGNAVYRMPLSIDLARAELIPGDKDLVGRRIIDLLALKMESSDCADVIPANLPFKCEIEQAFRWSDKAAGCPVILVGAAAISDEMDIESGGIDGLERFEQKIHFFPRPDVALTNDLFISRKREGHGFIIVIRNFPQARKEIGIFIKNSRHKWLAAERQIEDLCSYRQFLKKIFEIRMNSTELSRIYSVALMPLIGELQERRSAAFRSAIHLTGFVGQGPQRPSSSIIIPLYGDLDHLEKQISVFAADAGIRNNAEVIYALDDPNLVDSFKIRIAELYGKYELPVRWIYWNANIGFSGANNIGASIARGKYLVFMNSDVFPIRKGWLTNFENFLQDHPDVGLAGCKLLYPDGTIQHCGIRFEYNPAMEIWHCIHPYRGEKDAPNLEKNPTYVKCVTGACVAVSKNDFQKAGGWSPDYLFGGYEDMDLCFKIAKIGKKIAYLPYPVMTHLESMTFKKIRDEWLDRLAVYNAAVFKEKWAKELSEA